MNIPPEDSYKIAKVFSKHLQLQLMLPRGIKKCLSVEMG